MGPLDQILALFEACPRPKPLSLSGSNIPCPFKTVEADTVPREKETLNRKPVSDGLNVSKRRDRRSPVPQRKRKWKPEQQRHRPPTQRVPPPQRVPHQKKRKKKGRKRTKEEPQQRVPFKPFDRRSKEERQRDEGMAEKLGPTNKGFAMLKAMGLEEGKGLGKAGEGRREPIPVKMHPGKRGLGWKRN